MTFETIDLTVNETTESRTIFTKSVKFSKYKNISKLWIDAILSAPSGILSSGWYLNKMLLNGKGVETNLGTSSNLKIFDSKVKGNRIDLVPNENNIITVGWNAPLGAGVISPHANITVRIKVEGELAVPGSDIIPSELLEAGNLSNITENLDKLGDRATIPSLIIIIILVVLAIAALLLLPRILLTKKILDEV